MIDQLIIGDKHSFDDFFASLNKRKIGQPAKKTIKETVPFSNITYDFTAINGEIYWEERELEYVFEITATTPEMLEARKSAFSGWVMNVMAESVFDPFIPEYHFEATYADMSWDDDEGLDKSTATVKFTAYPYKIANLPKVYEVILPAYGSETIQIVNDSSHRMTPAIITDGPVAITIDGKQYTTSAGVVEDERVKLAIGLNEMTFKNLQAEPFAVTVRFYEEVF